MSEAPWQIAGQKGLWIPLEQYEAKIAGLEAERDQWRTAFGGWDADQSLEAYKHLQVLCRTVQQELDAQKQAYEESAEDFLTLHGELDAARKLLQRGMTPIGAGGSLAIDHRAWREEATRLLAGAAPQPEGRYCISCRRPMPTRCDHCQGTIDANALAAPQPEGKAR
jgi:hypothetical protein